MANTIRKTVIAVFLTLISFQISTAQDSPLADKVVVVYLNDGSIMSGKLIELNYGTEVIIEDKGIRITFPYDKIMKVVEESALKRIKAPVYIKNTGIYYSAKAQIMAGNAGRRANDRMGLGVTASAGYQWNQYLALGLGIGYREFIWDTQEKLYPLFAEMKGYLSNNAVRPFYNLEVGYAFATADEDLGLTDAQGGLMIYPSIGIAMGRKQLKTTLDLGYNFQNAVFTYGNNFDDRITNVHDITYKRLSLRLGLEF